MRGNEDLNDELDADCDPWKPHGEKVCPISLMRVKQTLGNWLETVHHRGEEYVTDEMVKEYREAFEIKPRISFNRRGLACRFSVDPEHGVLEVFNGDRTGIETFEGPYEGVSKRSNFRDCTTLAEVLSRNDVTLVFTRGGVLVYGNDELDNI